MRRMIFLLPLVAMSLVACNRNNDQADTTGPGVATAQGPTNATPDTGAPPPNGTDNSGTATDNTTPGSSAAGQGGTANLAPDNNGAAPAR